MSLITAAAFARARDAARTRIRPDTSMKAATHVQLAGWKGHGEDAPVENRGEHELEGIAYRWHLYCVAGS